MSLKDKVVWPPEFYAAKKKLKPITSGSYVCGCGSRKEHPETAFCWDCDQDNWISVEDLEDISTGDLERIMKTISSK